MSLSMTVSWFMFVLYIDVFHFLKQCCCAELEECICMYVCMHNIQVCILFSAPVKRYTDDTAMAKCIAESLIAHERFDALDIAKR